MNILISNDDGIHATGIHILTECLSQIAEIYVAAPAFEQSGASHGLTTKMPLRAEAVEMKGAVSAWAIEGLPADCVKLAIEQLMDKKPDMVVSGINHGPNLGTDTIYSGTVAAAAEGYLYGIPSIAVSVRGSGRRKEDQGNFQLSAEITRDFCLQLLKLPQPVLLNINVPGGIPSEVKGIKYTQDPSGRNYYWLQGELEAESGPEDDDVIAYAHGYASVSPLQVDMTDYTLLQRLPELNGLPKDSKKSNSSK